MQQNKRKTSTSEKGHSVATSTRIIQDNPAPDGNNSPGGSFSMANVGDFTCASCHDPHGNANYRILLPDPDDATVGDINLSAMDTLNPLSDIWDGSVNVAQGTGNHIVYLAKATNGTGDLLVANISDNTAVGLGLWCADCHGDFHGGETSDTANDVWLTGPPTGWGRRPTSKVLDTIAGIYDSQSADKYDHNVPLEVSDDAVTAGFAVNNDTLAETDADAYARVFCLSCHKAHGTNYANSLRWDYTYPRKLDHRLRWV